MKYKPHTVNQKDTIQYDNMLWEIKISNSIILKKPTPQKIGLSEYSEDYLDPIEMEFPIHQRPLATTHPLFKKNKN